MYSEVASFKLLLTEGIVKGRIPAHHLSHA